MLSRRVTAAKRASGVVCSLKEPWSAVFREYTDLPMPALSPTMSVGRIASWKKKDGEPFKVDDVLCEVETDKAVVDFAAVEEGIIAKILIPAGGEPVPVGATLAIIVEDASEIPRAIEEYSRKKPAQQTVKGSAVAAESKPKSEPAVVELKGKASVPKAEEVSSRPRGDGKQVPVTPAARSILGEHIDFSQIKGSGKDGRIMKEDALSFVTQSQQKAAQKSTDSPSPSSSSTAIGPLKSFNVAAPSVRAPKAPAQSSWLPDDRGPFRDVPLSMMRRVIAQRLSESKEKMPHAYATMETGIESALEARTSLKNLGMHTPSMNDLVVRACALALRDVPALNVRLENNVVKPNEKVDVSVAVATPGGLITPIIENADLKSPMEISTKMKDLAARAKENKLKPAEFQGGSFTVSNLGMLGIDDFTAIINAPQVAILAVGSGKKSLVVPSGAKREVIQLGSIHSRTQMIVALSFDPRAVSEINAAKFLQSFKNYIEAPSALFMSGVQKRVVKA